MITQLQVHNDGFEKMHTGLSKGKYTDPIVLEIGYKSMERICNFIRRRKFGRLCGRVAGVNRRL